MWVRSCLWYIQRLMQTRSRPVYGNLWDEWERNAGKRCLLQGSLLCTKGHSVLLQACAFYINSMQAATAAKEETPSAVFSWKSRLFRAVGVWQFILSICDSSSPLKSWQALLLHSKHKAAPREGAHKSNRFQLTFQVWLLGSFRFGRVGVFCFVFKEVWSTESFRVILQLVYSLFSQETWLRRSALSFAYWNASVSLLMGRKESLGQNFWQSFGFCRLENDSSGECFFPLEHEYT